MLVEKVFQIKVPSDTGETRRVTDMEAAVEEATLAAVLPIIMAVPGADVPDSFINRFQDQF